MAKYRDQLPQLNNELFLTDGGIETTLVFHDGIDLPHFAAYTLLASDSGSQKLADCYAIYAEIANEHGVGIVLETPTWRASRDWGALLGHDEATLAQFNRKSVRLLQGIRDRFETERTPIVISGNLGPRGDGYDPGRCSSPEEAETYHRAQIEVFANTHADLISALTLTHSGEAIGIVRAARAAGMPVVICFTVETDGRLPTGQTIGEAIEETDEATDDDPLYYGINCAHPTHFAQVLEDAIPARWLDRLHALRGNASTKSHQELDEATELDDGDPREFGRQCRALRQKLPNINVLGGCCGTDHRHIEAIIRSAETHPH